MFRPHPTPLAAGLAPALLPVLLLATVSPATTIIDSFESGSQSRVLTSPGTSGSSVAVSPAHCISNNRDGFIEYPAGAYGTLSLDVVPLEGNDDSAVISFPAGGGQGWVVYDGGPWDLTDGGTDDRFQVRLAEAAPGAWMYLNMKDDLGAYMGKSTTIQGAGTYSFSLAGWTSDVTSIVEISLRFQRLDAGLIELQDIRTANWRTIPLTWTAVGPTSLTWLCPGAQEEGAAAEAPGVRRGGGASSLAFDWSTSGDNPVTVAGPVLEVAGISGAGCSSVTFDASDSEPGAAFGEMGLISMNWDAPTFDNAIFDMFYSTSPVGSYIATPQGDPVVTYYPDAFVVRHEVHLSGMDAVPNGVVQHELVVSVHPAQEAYFDYVDALPWGGGSNETGYSLGFALSGGGLFDPGSPLLEMWTTATYSDDAGDTGVEEVGPASDDAATLAAHPSVTRSETRFVLPSDAGKRAIVDVFDVAGRRVRRLEARSGEVAWDGAGESGARVPTGVYFGRVEGVAGAARVIVLR